MAAMIKELVTTASEGCEKVMFSVVFVHGGRGRLRLRGFLIRSEKIPGEDVFVP